MKLRYLTILFALLLISLTVLSNDYFLLPELFMPNKGETVNIHLVTGEGFDKNKEYQYQASEIAKFDIYDGGKKIDLKAIAKDTGAAILNYKLNNPGLVLVEMERSYTDIDLDKNDLLDEINVEGQTKIFDKVNNSGQYSYKERYVSYLKTLMAVEKPSGDLYNKDLGHTLEITLEQNPYKLSYGDDITAVVKLNGKRLPNAHIDLIVKTVAGKYYPQRLNTDATGDVYFKVSHEGIYLLRMVILVPSKTKGIDFDKWGASYTFGFTNGGALPNSYKDFGMGDKH